MKGRRFFTIITFLVVALFMTTCSIACEKADDEGSLKIAYVLLDGTKAKEVELKFTKEDTLKELVSKNFSNVTFDNGMIMSMEDYVTPKDYHTFLSIYVDNEMSLYGINDINLKNGMIVEFRITEFSY